MSMVALSPRLVELASGLRELADWIEENPDHAIKITNSTPVTLLACVMDARELREFGTALGVDLEIDYQWAKFVRSFGGVVRLQAYGPRDQVCEYEVVGSRTEEIREWRLKNDESEQVA